MSSGHRSKPAEIIPDGLYERTRALVATAAIDRSHDVKTLANRSSDSLIVYIDSSVPVILPKTGIDTGDTLPWHELAEWLEQNAGQPYDDAHPIATAVEKKRVEELGGDWKEYTAEMDGLIAAVDKKPILNPPPDQDERVFESERPTMPTPNKDEKQEDFVKRCIPVVLKDGTTKDNDQAVAICESIFREHEKKESAVETKTDVKSWYKIIRCDLDNPSDPPEITMYDEIGGWGIGADQFQRDLKALGDVKEIKLRINSPGGDAFQGITIHNLLKSHPAKITAHVDGIAASAASHILMAADKRIMPQNTFLVIHEPSGLTYGPPKQHRAMAEDLDRVKDGQAKDYAAASGQSIKAVKSLMEEDRLMSAKEAAELGYCTECTGAAQMNASFALDKLPEKFRSIVSSIAFEQTQEKQTQEKPMSQLIAAEVARVTALRQIGADAKADAKIIEAAIESGIGTDEFKTVLAGIGAAAAKAAAQVPAYGEAEINETLEICALGKVSVTEAMKFVSAKTPVAEVRTKVQAMAAAAVDRNSVSRVDPNNLDEDLAGVDPEARAVAAQFPGMPGQFKGADPKIVARKLAINKQLRSDELRQKR